MQEIVLASNNKKKIAELETLLGEFAGGSIKIQSLGSIGYTDDILEDGTSFEENSLIKAGTPAALGYVGIADDSGLAVDYLNGAPGIYSARYAGEKSNDKLNREKLLRELDGVPMEKRGAHFVCTAALVLPPNSGYTIPEEWRISSELSAKTGIPCENAMTVRGECYGVILTCEAGEGGFGYDSLFYYAEYGKSFAEISPSDKNKVSHRGIAMKEFTHRIYTILKSR